MTRSKKRPALDPSRAVAYLRVSTEDQALGPEAQRASIEAWAARQGLQVATWHTDQGVSGAAAIEERPGLLAALRDLEEQRAAHLVVAKWDRLARDVMLSAMVERMAERLGARVVSADGVGAGDGPRSSLHETVYAPTIPIVGSACVAGGSGTQFAQVESVKCLTRPTPEPLLASFPRPLSGGWPRGVFRQG